MGQKQLRGGQMWARLLDQCEPRPKIAPRETRYPGYGHHCASSAPGQLAQGQRPAKAPETREMAPGAATQRSTSIATAYSQPCTLGLPADASHRLGDPPLFPSGQQYSIRSSKGQSRPVTLGWQPGLHLVGGEPTARPSLTIWAQSKGTQVDHLPIGNRSPFGSKQSARQVRLASREVDRRRMIGYSSTHCWFG